MDYLVGTVAAAVGVFVGTNVDDLIVLAVLFVSSRANGVPRPWQVWVGQYAGIATLVAVSAVAALGLAALPDRWVGLLGLIPFGLGVRSLIGAFRGGDADPGSVVATGVLSVAGITIANGADNLAVYTPMLRTIGLTSSVITVAVFAVLTGVWCAVGSWLGSHRSVVAVIKRYGHWLVPVVFMAIGLVIILQSGVIAILD